MSYYRRWRPSKAASEEFHQKMEEIEAFCASNGIEASYSKDSYYFTIGGQKYRVSNHSVEASNLNSLGEYHKDGRRPDTVYIHAGKTRIIEIYSDLMSGYKLDGHGCRV